MSSETLLMQELTEEDVPSGLYLRASNVAKDLYDHRKMLASAMQFLERVTEERDACTSESELLIDTVTTLSERVTSLLQQRNRDAIDYIQLLEKYTALLTLHTDMQRRSLAAKGRMHRSGRVS